MKKKLLIAVLVGFTIPLFGIVAVQAQTGSLGEPLRIAVTAVQTAITNLTDSNLEQDIESAEAEMDEGGLPLSPAEGESMNPEVQQCGDDFTCIREVEKQLWLKSKPEGYKVVEISEDLDPIFIDDSQANPEEGQLESVRTRGETTAKIEEDPLAYATLLREPTTATSANGTTIGHTHDACVQSRAYCFPLNEANTSVEWDLEIIVRQVSNPSSEFIFASISRAQAKSTFGDSGQFDFSKSWPSTPCIAYTVRSVMTLENGRVISSEPTEFVPFSREGCHNGLHLESFDVSLAISPTKGQAGGASMTGTEIQGSFSFASFRKVDESKSYVSLRKSDGTLMPRTNVPMQCGPTGIGVGLFTCSLNSSFPQTITELPLGNYEIVLSTISPTHQLAEGVEIGPKFQEFKLGDIVIDVSSLGASTRFSR